MKRYKRLYNPFTTINVGEIYNENYIIKASNGLNIKTVKESVKFCPEYWEEITEFQKGDYIVLLNSLWDGSNSFIINYCIKQRENEVNNKGKYIKHGCVLLQTTTIKDLVNSEVDSICIQGITVYKEQLVQIIEYCDNL